MKKMLIFFVLLSSFFMFAACDLLQKKEEKEQAVFSEPVLILNSVFITEKDAFFKEDGSIFLSLDILKNNYENPDIEYNSCGIKALLHLADFCLEEDFDEMSEIFYDEDISFLIPSFNYKNKQYVNALFLSDLLDITVLDLGNSVALFTNEDDKIMPNAKAFLPKYSKLYKKNKLTYEEWMTLPASSEVYVVNHPTYSPESFNDLDNKLACYIENIGLCYVNLEDLDAVSLYRHQPKKISLTYKKDKYKIMQFGWQNIQSYQDSILKMPKEKIKGLDVIMPSCFSFGENMLKSSLSQEYMLSAKDAGYLVYGYFTSGGDGNYFRNILATPSKMRDMMDSLLFYSAYFELDGLNFDFSNLNRSDRESVDAFFPDLATRAHKLGLSVSLCVPAVDSSSMKRNLKNKDLENAPLDLGEKVEKTYDEKIIAEGYINFDHLQTSVDLFMLMAIDQYNSSSKMAGPVSSVTWTEDNLKQLVSVMPSEKIVLAQPNYLRIFTMDEYGEVVQETSVCSEKDLKERLENRSIKHLYDTLAMQDVIEFTDLEKPLLHRVWLEDEKNLTKRLELVKDYGLKGYAVWNMDFEEAWQSKLRNKVLGE